MVAERGAAGAGPRTPVEEPMLLVTGVTGGLGTLVLERLAAKAAAEPGAEPGARAAEPGAVAGLVAGSRTPDQIGRAHV